MASDLYDFTIKQGTTHTFYLIWTDSVGAAISLSGYTARMKIKAFPGSSTNILSLTSTPAAGLTITAGSGRVDVSITATQTTAFTFNTAYYDLEVESGAGVVTRLLQGTITLLREVTS